MPSQTSNSTMMCRSCKFSMLCLWLETEHIVQFLIGAKRYESAPCGAWKFYWDRNSHYYQINGVGNTVFERGHKELTDAQIQELYDIHGKM